MSKEYKNIDDLYKAELGGSAAKAPAHVKANVDKALGFGSSKKLLWILLPILIVLVATPFIYNSFQSEDLAQNSPSDFPAQNDTNNSANTSSSNPSNSNNTNLSEYNQTTSSEIQHENSNRNNQINSSTNTINDADLNNTNSQFQSNTNSNSTVWQEDKKLLDNKTNKTNPSVNKTSNTVTNKNLINPEENKNKVTSDNKTTVNDKDLADNKMVEKTIPKTTLAKDSIQNQKDKTPIKDDLIVRNNLTPDSTSLLKKDAVNLINSDTLTDNIIDTTTQNINDLIVDDKDAVDSTNTNNNVNIDPAEDLYQPWLLSLSTGVNFKNSTITAANPSDSAAYTNTINDRIGHSASFDAQYRLKNSLTFGAGIGYSTLIENFNYYKSEITTDSALTYVYFQDSIPDSMGWIYFTDSTAEYTYTTDSNEIYNANGRNINTYLHIPISLGTQLRFNKVYIDLFAQGRFNLLLISKATYVENDQLVTTNLAAIKRSYFDLVLGTNVHYNIVGNLFLTGTVRYRPPLNNPYYVNGMTNRFSNLHLGIGVSLNL